MIKGVQLSNVLCLDNTTTFHRSNSTCFGSDFCLHHRRNTFWLVAATCLLVLLRTLNWSACFVCVDILLMQISEPSSAPKCHHVDPKALRERFSKHRDAVFWSLTNGSHGTVGQLHKWDSECIVYNVLFPRCAL